MSLKITVTYGDGDVEIFYKQAHLRLLGEVDRSFEGRTITFLRDDVEFVDHPPRGGKIEVEGW